MAELQCNTIDTTCVQGGWRPGDGDPRQVPIYQNTTWKYDSSEHMGRLFDLEESGYFYTRLAEPHQRLPWPPRSAELEGGTAAMLTSPRARRRTSSRCSTSPAAETTWWLARVHLRRHLQPAGRTPCGAWASTVHLRRPALHPTRSWMRPSGPTRSAVFGETIANPALAVLDIERVRRGGPRPRGAAHRGQHVPHAGATAAPSSGAPTSSPTPLPSTWTATAPSVGGAIVDSGQLRLGGPRRQVPGPHHPRRQLPRRELYRSASARKAPSSPRQRPSSCATWALSSRRRTPSW